MDLLTHDTRISIRHFQSQDDNSWDKYVHNHPQAVHYHLSGWKNVIEKTYGHKTYYLMAVKQTDESIVGILPLVHLKHFFFGNSLISMPFFDNCGILADDANVAKKLLLEAIKIGQILNVQHIELRHVATLNFLDKFETNKEFSIQALSHKTSMILPLPETSKILLKSFKSKLRSQVNKPLKEGLISKTGDVELLSDFFKVFAINMRDIGSPVHSKKLIQNVITEFNDSSKIMVIYKGKQPVAVSLVLNFGNIVSNPWASSLRKYCKLSPNMLLYWTMLKYSCDNGFKYFDFGRSTPGEGTYKFKEQWGATPLELQWHFIHFNGKMINQEPSTNTSLQKFVNVWKKMPVFMTKLIGPGIRKYIGL